MFFKVLYTIFVIAQLLFGSFTIGPVTPRQVMTVIMLVVCGRNNAIKLDKYFGIYLVFIVGYILAQIYTGYMFEMIRLLLGYYLVSYVAYQSTKLFIRKTGNANLLLVILFFVGIADGLVTVGQMYQVPYAHEISLLLGNNALGDIYDAMSARSQENMLGYTIPGLFGPVPNGYFISAITLLCFYNKKAKITIINLVLVFFFIYTTFIIQERTALVACVVLSLFSLYKFMYSQGESSVFKKSWFSQYCYLWSFLLCQSYLIPLCKEIAVMQKDFRSPKNEVTLIKKQLSLFFASFRWYKCIYCIKPLSTQYIY